MCLKYIVYVIVLLVAGVLSCRDNFSCVSIKDCKLNKDDFIFPCHNGTNMICCPEGLLLNANKTDIVTRTALFPVNCGTVLNDDRITGGHIATIGQFPWMALLGYKQRGIEFTQFLCGGSLITSDYILTAAHCLNLPELELVLIRLGELNLSTDPDCEDIFGVQTCADPHVEIQVLKIIVHKMFNTLTLKNDIALVKMQKKVTFTDFIQPICIPFGLNVSQNTLTDKKFSVSGWGKTKSENLGGSTTLQFTKVTAWQTEKCNRSIPPEVKPIKDKQICANGQKKEDACKGDSGGPLINATVEGTNVKTYQIGIVSFASAQVCGNADLPTIYTKVDRYLSWIVKNVK